MNSRKHDAASLTLEPILLLEAALWTDHRRIIPVLGKRKCGGADMTCQADLVSRSEGSHQIGDAKMTHAWFGCESLTAAFEV